MIFPEFFTSQEARQKDEGAQTHSNIRNSRKPAYAKIARETYNEVIFVYSKCVLVTFHFW